MAELKQPLPGRIDRDRFISAVTLRQIRYFIAAAESGKVSLAASMINISPSAVTEAIAELEALSGTRLFTRHPRGLSLTYEGHRFLAHCRNVLTAVTDASYAFDKPDSRLEGAFTLAVTSTIGGYFLVPLLSRFQRTFPNIEVKLVEAQRVAIEQGLLRSDYDLSLMLVSNIAEDTALSRYDLIHSVRRLWLAPRHPLTSRDSITLEDIGQEPYIQLTIDDADVSTLTYWRANGLEPNIVFRTQSVEAVRSLIAFGHGVTILSDMMYRPWSLEGDRVEVRDIATGVPTMNAGLVWRRGSSANPFSSAFMTFCRMEFEGAHPGASRVLAGSLNSR